MSNKHYIALAGLLGYLPNVSAAFENEEDCIDFLCSIHDDSPRKKLRRELKEYGFSECIKGNEYCEILICECDDMHSHDDN